MKYLEMEASLARRRAYERSVIPDGSVTTRVHTTKCVIEENSTKSMLIDIAALICGHRCSQSLSICDQVITIKSC